MQPSGGTQLHMIALKQISIKRRTLERSTEQLRSNLQSLQQENTEQHLRISHSLHELQQAQKEAEELLGDTWQRHAEQGNTNNNSNDLLLSEIDQWPTVDVVKWLRKGQLHKFEAAFKKHSVCGKDLVDCKLDFLDEMMDVTTEDKENLLAFLYDLLNPESIQVSQSELIKIKTIADKDKYLAAVHIAQAKDSASSKSQQTSVVLMTSRRASPMSSTTTSAQSSPRERRRGRSSSESDMKIALHKRNAANEISRSFTSNLEQESRQEEPKNEQDKEVPVVDEPGVSCIYSVIQSAGPKYIKTMQISNTDLDIVYKFQLKNSGHVTMTEQLKTEKHLRVLEVNGVLCSSITSNDDLQQIITSKTTTQVVVIDEASNGLRNIESLSNIIDVDTQGQEEKRRKQVSNSEAKWQDLRSILVSMREENVDPGDIVDNIPTYDIDTTNQQDVLQEEVIELRKGLEDYEKRVKNLQTSLKAQVSAFTDMEQERDQAVARLQHLIGYSSSNDDDNMLDIENAKPVWERLESSSKEEILRVLRETYVESSRQKSYLDQLMSAVVERAPWLLDDIETEFESVTSLPSHSEQWC